MSTSIQQRYPLDNDNECERLEAQADFSGIRDHFRHIHSANPENVLDVGCGSGSMSRLLALHYPRAKVVGLDFKTKYLAYAAERANKEGIDNLTFQEGDAHQLPFGDGSFDLIWTKYVVFFLQKPELALGEFRRVLRSGGQAVIVLSDWPRLVLDPVDPELSKTFEKAIRGSVDTTLPGRLPT
jgi:ubiquinone/menaquinone biosynthesis C-methylase UbiE